MKCREMHKLKCGGFSHFLGIKSLLLLDVRFFSPFYLSPKEGLGALMHKMMLVSVFQASTSFFTFNKPTI